jgi:hypothetical protein
MPASVILMRCPSERASMTEFEVYQQQVIDWVSEWSKRHNLSPMTSINRGLSGLGIDGQDADELIEFLSRKSGISFSDFDFDRYFGPELGLGHILVQPWGVRRWFTTPKLTIGELALYMHTKLTMANREP